VERTEGEDAEDEQIERSLGKLGVGFGHGRDTYSFDTLTCRRAS
jgi:hypothetical protein